MNEKQEPGRTGVPAPETLPPERPLTPGSEAGWSEIPLPREPAQPEERRVAHELRTRSTRRRALRFPASFRVTMETMDPVRDPVTGEMCFQASEDDRTVDLSRFGLRLRAENAPSVGTRLLLRLHLPEESRPLEFVGRARWTRVELERGTNRRRAVCGVGVELLGGPRRSLDRYGRLLDELRARVTPAVAGGKGLR